MAGIALKFLDKMDLECCICLERCIESKTLTCLHSYCPQCEEHLVEKCPKCWDQQQKRKEGTLKNINSNSSIHYPPHSRAQTIESEKQRTCSSCDNQPKYHCSECLLYLCEDCSKDHKIIPSLKDHPLYILNQNERSSKNKQKNSVQNTEFDKQRTCSYCDNQPKYHCSECLLYLCEECSQLHEIIPLLKDHPLSILNQNERNSKDKQKKFPIHYTNVLEYYCSTSKSACKKCDHCYDTTEMQTVVEKFQQSAQELFKTAESKKNNLKRTHDSISNDMFDFESHIKACRKAIEVKEKTFIKKVEAKSQTIISEVEDIYKIMEEDIESKITQVNKLMVTINTMINKPEETDILGSYKLKAIRNKFLEINNRTIIPKFILSTNTHLEELINTEGFGITIVDRMYQVAQCDEEITVTKGQPFVVKVSNLAESDTCQLTATLKNLESEKSLTEVEYQGKGEYKITGRCNLEGDWQLKINAGAAQIKGSPVNIKVESLGLVYSICDNGGGSATNLVLDTNGCILASGYRRDILKFNQSGMFVGMIKVPQHVIFSRIFLMDDGHFLYNHFFRKCVVMCNNKFQEICSFGEETLHCPEGLTVNNKTRVLYVADIKVNCVCKFNVNDGRLLGKIGSEGSEAGQMKHPVDVTLNKKGLVIVADYGNHRIQIFDVNDNLMKVVCHEILYPNCLTTDNDENIIVSSSYKIELFDKNGVFIKIIDKGDDEKDIFQICDKYRITVISNRPRRVAVAHIINNCTKIFNY